MKVAIEGTKQSIVLATEDLGMNRDSQKSTTQTRTDAHAVFTETLTNCEDAEKILAKAVEVLQRLVPDADLADMKFMAAASLTVKDRKTHV